MCENEVSKTVTSPSGELVVAVFNRGCGATSGFNTQISIIKADDKLENDGGNLFIADGTLPLEVRWNSEAEVIISGVGNSEIYKKENSLNGVAITYESQVK